MTVIKVRSADVASRQVGDDLVLLDERTSTYLQLTGSGLLLWPELVRGTTHEGLVEVLCREYGITPDRAGSDVEEFLTHLSELGLLDSGVE